MNKEEEQKIRDFAEILCDSDFDNAPVADELLTAMDPEKETFALFSDNKVIAIVSFKLVISMMGTIMKVKRGDKPDGSVVIDEKVMN